MAFVGFQPSVMGKAPALTPNVPQALKPPFLAGRSRSAGASRCNQGGRGWLVACAAIFAEILKKRGKDPQRPRQPLPACIQYFVQSMKWEAEVGIRALADIEAAKKEVNKQKAKETQSKRERARAKEREARERATLRAQKARAREEQRAQKKNEMAEAKASALRHKEKEKAKKEKAKLEREKARAKAAAVKGKDGPRKMKAKALEAKVKSAAEAIAKNRAKSRATA